MDDTLDELGQMLDESVRSFLKKQDVMERIRANRGSGQTVDLVAWRTMAQAGWLGLNIPERAGGAGLGLGQCVLLARLFSTALVPEPYLFGAAAPGSLLAALPQHAATDQLMSELCEGAGLFSFVPPDLSEAPQPQLRFARQDGTIILEGPVALVLADANIFLVCGDLDGETAIAAVPADTNGLQRHRVMMASGVAAADLRFTQSHLPAAAILAQGDPAVKAVSLAWRDALVIAAAQLSAIADAAITQTAAYLKQRSQFGQLLSEFQALRHRLVDMALQAELSRAAVRRAVARADAGEEAAVLAAVAAKARASQAVLDVCEAAVHLHGAMGYTAEAEIGHFLDAALRWSAALGNAAAHRRRFGTLADLQELAA